MLSLLLSGCLVNNEVHDRRARELADHDGDSFAFEDDCDDEDSTIFPGAYERCDDVDQDCDGEIDEDAVDATLWYVDADSDGHGAATNLVEGCEQPDADFVEVPDDCDDTNAEAYPGASEVPYDGVDQDCDGADLNDLDGDGWSSAQTGGDDCDDRDPSVYPDAEETWADGFTDNDCDGELETLVFEVGSNVWSGWRAGDALGRKTASLGDLDEDGLDDVLVGSELDATVGDGAGAVYALDGAPGGTLEGAHALLPEVAGLAFASMVDAGVDATGDGVPDVLVAQPGTADVAGTAWIADGAAWAGLGGATIDQVQAARVEGSAPGTYGPGAARFVGDVTGDGVVDIALGECCGTAGGASTVGRVAIFSTDAFAGSIDDADVLLEGPWEGAYVGGGVDALGDQDGDGLDELLISGTGGLAAAVVGGTASGNLADLAITSVYGNVSSGYTIARRAGDLDGDGRDDVSVLGEDADGEIYLFTDVGTPTRLLDAPTCVFDWAEQGGVVDIVALGDRDGDDRGELFIPLFFSDSGNERFWIVPGSAVTFGGTIEADASSLSGVSMIPGSTFGYSAALAGDVDGDCR